MKKIGAIGTLAAITLTTIVIGFASNNSFAAGVVPPVGSTCEVDKSGTEQHCTFPDGSKWTCNMDLSKCHRTQKGAPSASLPAVSPSGAVSESAGGGQSPASPIGSATARTMAESTEGVTIRGTTAIAKKGYTFKRLSPNQVVVTPDKSAMSAAGIKISCSCGGGSGTCKITKKTPTGGLFCENGSCGSCGWSEIEGIRPKPMLQ